MPTISTSYSTTPTTSFDVSKNFRQKPTSTSPTSTSYQKFVMCPISSPLSAATSKSWRKSIGSSCSSSPTSTFTSISYEKFVMCPCSSPPSITTSKSRRKSINSSASSIARYFS